MFNGTTTISNVRLLALAGATLASSLVSVLQVVLNEDRIEVLEFDKKNREKIIELRNFQIDLQDQQIAELKNDKEVLIKMLTDEQLIEYAKHVTSKPPVKLPSNF